MDDNAQSGHRERLRERFLANTEDSCSEERILELLLTFAIPRKDVQPIAQELIHKFASLSGVLSAAPKDLAEVKGVGQSAIVLMKMIDFIRSCPPKDHMVSQPEAMPDASVVAPAETSSVIEQEKFDLDSVQQPQITETKSTPTLQQTSTTQTAHHQETSEDKAENIIPTPKSVAPSRPSVNRQKTVEAAERKFQVSNGYPLEFDQLARIMHFLLENRRAQKINRQSLQESTGLAERHVGSLVSMGAAMGLIQPGRQTLTPSGLLIAQHDIFIEKKSSLEWCHYVGASSYRNLIWFEVFNRLLPEETAMTQEAWDDKLRQDLAGQYSKKTIGKALREEVRFVVDAYLERNFSKLQLLQSTSDSRLYIRRYTDFNRLVLCAMIYDFCASRGAHLYQLSEMVRAPGSPALLFGLDIATLRQQIEMLHDQGWLRYETTHNLDQIRLKPGFSALEFLTAHFEDRSPRELAAPVTGDLFE